MAKVISIVENVYENGKIESSNLISVSGENDAKEKLKVLENSFQEIGAHFDDEFIDEETGNHTVWYIKNYQDNTTRVFRIEYTVWDV